jgi:hypothetical protein
MAAVSLERFESPDYQITGRLQEVPHLGGITDGKLAAKGITSTYQLLGHFLSGNRDKDKFIQFLAEMETPGAHRKTLADAIYKRVSACGIKVAVEVPAEVDGKVVSSKIDDVKAGEIQRRKFNKDLRHDFAGCGFGSVGDKEKNKSVKALEAHGITSSDQLFGAMLKHFDQSPKTENVVAFWKELQAIGVAGGYKTTIIEAMKLKLDIGIDNCAKPALQPLPEDPPEEAPGTGQKSRTLPLSAGAATAAAAAKKKAEDEAKKQAEDEAKKKASGLPTHVYVLPVLVAVGWFFLSGSSPASAELPAPAQGEWL